MPEEKNDKTKVGAKTPTKPKEETKKVETKNPEPKKPESKKEEPKFKGVKLIKKIIKKNDQGKFVEKKYELLAENEEQAKKLMAYDERIEKA